MLEGLETNGRRGTHVDVSLAPRIDDGVVGRYSEFRRLYLGSGPGGD